MPVVLEPVHCPTCHETQIVKHGKSAAGKQRYKCCNSNCTRQSFILIIPIKAVCQLLSNRLAIWQSTVTSSGCGWRSMSSLVRLWVVTLAIVQKTLFSPMAINASGVSTMRHDYLEFHPLLQRTNSVRASKLLRAY